jgi:hypothetical protein
MRSCQVAHMHDGKLIESWILNEDQAAYDAFFS